MNKIIEKINESSKIALSFHTSPDGDSLGSSLAFLQGLRTLGKEVYIVCKEDMPKTFKFLPYSNEIINSCDVVKEGTDIFIVLDCGNLERVNTNSELSERDYTLINIDHHMSNDLYGDLNYVDTKASSMGEIVFMILEAMNIEVTKDMAKCMYTSILTDTGSFRHSNTTSRTHNIAGKLLDTGIDFSEIHRQIFDNKEFNRVKFMGRAIESLKLTLDGKVGVIKIRDKDFEDFGIEDKDTSDIVNIGMKIGSVDVMILLKEGEEGTKVSLRSKNIVDVRKVAENFGGGGHVRASGARIMKSIDESEELLLKIIEEEFKI